MLTTTFRDEVLNLLDGHFCSLITAITDFRAGTATEASYTGYGTRPAIVLGSPGNTSPAGGRQRANTGTVIFPQNTGLAHDVIGFGIETAATAGTRKAIGFLDDDPPVLGTTDDTSDLVTAPAHGLVADQRVFVLASPGAPLPTGLAENIAYFVLAAGLTASAFALSLTSGGAAIDMTTRGAGLFMPYKTLTVLNNATPEFAISTLVTQL